MGKTAAIPMDKEIQNFLFIFTGQQYMFLACFSAIWFILPCNMHALALLLARDSLAFSMS